MPARITKPAEQNLFMIAAMIVISVQGVIRSERLSLIRGQQKICYMANRKICEQCEGFESCVSSTIYGRSITRKIAADILEWADNCLPRYQRQRLMRRRMYKAEGSFADAANNHGFKRARWRGLTKVKMQNLMIATIQNLRKLLRYIGELALPKLYKRV